jgi:hypothetical protein
LSAKPKSGILAAAMDARFHSAGRWLFLPAVLLCLWALTAQAITRNPVSFVPEQSPKSSFSPRLERDVPRQESPSVLVVVRVWPDGRIGIFCGGDPINSFDSDGRLASGFYAGLTGGTVPASASSAFMAGYFGGGETTTIGGQINNEVQAANSPFTYINGALSFGNNINSYYQNDGILAASSYALTSWNVGAIYSGVENYDLTYNDAGQSVGDWYQRGEDIASGTAATASIAAGGLGLWNWATAPTTTSATVSADTASATIAASTPSYPLGFSSADQFSQAVEELNAALEKSGISDATVGVRGSSVTGTSFSTGAPFSPSSDIDFYIESDQLTTGLPTSQNIPGFVYPSTINATFDPIAEWSEIWSENLGRNVSAGGFQPGTVPPGPAIVP